jgi:hypothetical protein
VTTCLPELFARPPAALPIESLDAWWRRHRALAERRLLPVDLALLAGFAADRLGYAFASGYQAAGAAMFGADDPARLTALCATEAGGAHPRAIETRLAEDADGVLRLEGHKRLVTLGTVAEVLYVVCQHGPLGAEGRKTLRVVRIDRREGVEVVPLPAAAVIPEIPHAEVRLHQVVVGEEEVLAGDGYERYLKPFRTVEDVHVHAALYGWLLQIARRSAWPEGLIEELAAQVMGASAIAAADPSSPATHLALAGLLASAERWLRQIEPWWQQVDEATRSSWQRDRVLLSVAGKARARRREVAWERLDRS